MGLYKIVNIVDKEEEEDFIEELENKLNFHYWKREKILNIYNKN
jgi:hypothetical protein